MIPFIISDFILALNMANCLPGLHPRLTKRIGHCLYNDDGIFLSYS
jgi:hypothetical protein